MVGEVRRHFHRFHNLSLDVLWDDGSGISIALHKGNGQTPWIPNTRTVISAGFPLHLNWADRQDADARVLFDQEFRGLRYHNHQIRRHCPKEKLRRSPSFRQFDHPRSLL